MGNKSSIQWTDATVNFWTGCKKVSDGCKYCYMYRDKERYGKNPSDVVRVSEQTIKAILRKLTEPSKIFTCSWSDFFIEEADMWRNEAWQIIRDHPEHTWLILTKRPERIMDWLPPDWRDGYPNVWLGVTVENQDAANKRLPVFLNVPAVVHFVSYEPAIGPLDLEHVKVSSCDMFGAPKEAEIFETFNSLGNEFSDFEFAIDWVIIGGESGNENGKYLYRQTDLNWFDKVISQCNMNKVPVFVKQFGTHLSNTLGLKTRHGGEASEWPFHYPREFPNQWSCVKTPYLKDIIDSIDTSGPIKEVIVNKGASHGPTIVNVCPNCGYFKPCNDCKSKYEQDQD